MMDFTDLNKIKAGMKKNTKICWIESPTNPTIKCTDIAAVAKICNQKGVMLVIDNTFMSPVLQVSNFENFIKFFFRTHYSSEQTL